MKIKVTMKDPDTLIDAIDDAVKDDVASIQDEDEREAVRAIRADKAMAVASKWFRYQEYLTVEIDTEAGTCVVMTPEA